MDIMDIKVKYLEALKVINFYTIYDIPNIYFTKVCQAFEDNHYVRDINKLLSNKMKFELSDDDRSLIYYGFLNLLKVYYTDRQLAKNKYYTIISIYADQIDFLIKFEEYIYNIITISKLI